MSPTTQVSPTVPWWQPVGLGAMAGGLGWGIRGQYGHETGAMIAGLLVCLVLTFLLCPGAPAGAVARAVALGTVAIGIGGSMTYGQTVGLTHDAPLVGNWAALRWGLLGLAIKGALWIGFAGAFLGAGLGGVRYRAGEVALLLAGLGALCWLGIQVLNEPFDPARRILPRIYFSDDWRWEPGADLKPRREVWGGLLAAWVGLVAYLHWARRDRVATRLALWAALGGAIGFPFGQSLQAFHAWNIDWFRTGPWAGVDPVINWWNFMETTFGAIMGAAMGWGLWRERARLAPGLDGVPSLPLSLEWILISVHAALLTLEHFGSVRWVDGFYDFGLVLAGIPLVLAVGGRWAAYAILFPITALPIAGKTLRRLVYEEHAIAATSGWLLLLVVPLLLTLGMAAFWMQPRRQAAPARSFLAPALLLATWLYFLLNYAFFHFPWPWQPWTPRTPNAVVFGVCAVGLSLAPRLCQPRPAPPPGA